MSVQASQLVDPEIIATKSQLWQPTVFFRQDWSQPFTLVSSWRTQVVSSRNQSEQRFGLLERPHRTIESRVLGWNLEEGLDGDEPRGQQGIQHTRNLMSRMAKARSLWPIYSDRVEITQLSQFVYTGDFKHRRFQVGGRVLGAHHDGPLIDNFSIAKVIAVSDTSITLSADLGGKIKIISHITGSINILVSPTVALTIPGVTKKKNELLVISAGRRSAGTPAFFPVVTWGGQTLIHVVRRGITSSDFSLYIIGGDVEDTRDLVVTYSDLKQQEVYGSVIVVGGADRLGLHAAAEGFEVSGAQPRFPITTTVANTLLIWHNLVSNSSASPHTPFPVGATGLFEFSSFTGPSRFSGMHKNLQLAVTETIGFDFASPASKRTLFNAVALKSGPGQFLYPLLEGDIKLSSEKQLQTDEHSLLLASVKETPGKSALEAWVTPGTAPTGFVIFDGHPIFHIKPNWGEVKAKARREGRENVIGTGITTDVYGNRPLQEFDVSLEFFERQFAHQFLEFFSSRGGRLHPFWYVNPAADYDILSVSGTTITVVAHSAETDWTFFNHIAIIHGTDEDIEIRKITTVVRDTVTGIDTITVDAPFPAITLSEIKRCAAAFLSRFESDAITETWRTFEVMEVERIGIVEVGRELEADFETVEPIEDLCPGGVDPDPWEPDPDIDICLTRCCDATPPAACNVCQDNDVILQCWCYKSQIESCSDDPGECCTNDCADAPLVKSTIKLLMTFALCDGVQARWEGPGGSFVSLDLSTGTWAFDVGANECCAIIEDVEITLCLICSDPADCDLQTIITENCQGFRKEVPFFNSGNNAVCSHVPVIQISCPACEDGDCP